MNKFLIIYRGILQATWNVEVIEANNQSEADNIAWEAAREDWNSYNREDYDDEDEENEAAESDIEYIAVPYTLENVKHYQDKYGDDVVPDFTTDP